MAERGLFTPARFFLLGTVCVTELYGEGSRAVSINPGVSIKDYKVVRSPLRRICTTIVGSSVTVQTVVTDS